MFYEYHLTIPPNTPASGLVSMDCPLDYGVITHVEIEFPPGCNGLAAVRVRERGHQLYPTNDKSFFISNAYVIAFSETYRLYSPPYLFFFEGYNLDEIYSHTITLRLAIIRPEDTLARYLSDIFFGLAYSPFDQTAKLGGASG